MCIFYERIIIEIEIIKKIIRACASLRLTAVSTELNSGQRARVSGARRGERKAREKSTRPKKKEEPSINDGDSYAFLALACAAIFAISCKICRRFEHFIATLASNNTLLDRIALRAQAWARV